MKAHISEDVVGLMNIVWLFVLASILIITIPVWVLPYTAYKIRKQLTEKNT